MTEPIIIEAIELQGFRVFLKPQSILLHKSNKTNLAIFASNGTGKSSLVDSLEYFFSQGKATLDRLGERATGTQAGPKYVRHISAGESDVMIRVRFKQGREEFEGSRTGDPIPEVVKRLLPLIKVPFIIRDYELRKFVEENRYAELVQWFALERLNVIQEKLRQLENQIKIMAKNSVNLDMSQDLEELTDGSLSAWDEPGALVWLNEKVLAGLSIKFEDLSDGDPAFQELINQKAAEQNRSGLDHMTGLLGMIDDLFMQPMAPHAEPTGQIITFEKTILDYEGASANESSVRSMTGDYVFKKVWDRAKELFVSDVDFNKCPVCNTEFSSSPLVSRDAILDNLRINLKNLDEYKKAEEKRQDAEERLIQAVNALRAKLDEFFRWAGSEYQHDAVAKYSKAMHSWEPGGKTPGSTVATRDLGRLHSTTLETINKMQQGRHTCTDALATVNGLLKFKADVDRRKRIESNLTIIKDRLARQSDILNRVIVRHVQDLVNMLQDEARDIYKEIQGPDAPISPVEIALPKEDKRNQRSARITIDFMNSGRKVPPNSVLSESQTRTLALAIRLAAIRIFNTEFKIIALDDVTMSYDDERRQHIASLLQERFKEYQIIITTHDEFFYKQLKARLPPKKWEFKEIKHVVDGYGPKIDDKKTLDMVIEEKLANNEIPGNAMRQAQEEWLKHICTEFGTSMRFDLASRPPLNELARSLQNFLKKQGYDPPKVRGYSGNYLDQIMNADIQNLTSHHNDNPGMQVSTGDLRVVWDEFLEFKEHFKCSACKENRFTREPGQKPKCKKCKIEFAFV